MSGLSPLENAGGLWCYTETPVPMAKGLWQEEEESFNGSDGEERGKYFILQK